MQLTKDNLLAALPERDEELKIKFGIVRKGNFGEYADYVEVPRMLTRFDMLMANLISKGRVIKSGGYWMRPSDKPPAENGKMKPQIGIHRMSAEQLLESFQTPPDPANWSDPDFHLGCHGY